MYNLLLLEEVVYRCQLYPIESSYVFTDFMLAGSVHFHRKVAIAQCFYIIES